MGSGARLARRSGAGPSFGALWLLATLLLAAWLCAGADGGHSAKARKTIAWETVYSGTYSYTGDMRFTGPGPGGTSVSDYNQSAAYLWTIDRLDTFTDNGNGTFTESVKVADLSSGTVTARNTITLANEQPDVATAVDCTIVSTGSPVQRSRTGIPGVPSKGPPEALVSWSVPFVADRTGQYYFDNTVFDPSKAPVYGDAPGVTQHCVDSTVHRNYVTQDGSNLLDAGVYSTNGSIIGNYPWFHYDKTSALGWQNHSYPTCGGRSLEPDAKYFDLWDGSRSIDLVDVPYSEDFSFEGGISGAMSHPTSIDTTATSGRCADHVGIDSHLSFVLLNCAETGEVPEPSAEPTSAPAPTGGPATSGTTSSSVAEFDATGGSTGAKACNKVGTLFLQDGIKIMSSAAAVLGTGENTTILMPGMPEGGAKATSETAIDLQVDAQVLPKKGVRKLAGAAGSTALYQGSATLEPGTPSLVTLHPTTQGRAFLTGRHPAIAVTATITAHGGAIGPQTAHGSFTIPASS